MNDDFLKLRSSIKPKLMQKTLFRGSIFGGIGASILLLAGTFMPISLLSLSGLPLFFLAFGLITFGMLPYRRLTRLEKCPDELILNERLTYKRRGKIICTIPLSSIKSCEYKEDESHYGIKITLEGKECFFPYFSQNAAKSLIEQCRAF